MFKGTPRFPAGMLDREIDRAGGQWNAFTSMDATKYFETLPADKIDIAMQAEADRMTNALFDPEETESERTGHHQRAAGRGKPADLLAAGRAARIRLPRAWLSSRNHRR